MTEQEATPRVIIGGAGPAGIVSARMLTDVGANVQVFDAGDEFVDYSRHNVAMIDDGARDTLERYGVEIEHHDEIRGLVTIDRATNELRQAASSAGVPIAYNCSIRSVEQNGAGVTITVEDADGTVHQEVADWYVSATGATDKELTSPQLLQKPHLVAGEPQIARILQVNTDHVPDLWVSMAVGHAWGFNTKLDGASWFRYIDEDEWDAFESAEAQRAAAEELVSRFGIEPEAVRTSRRVFVQQALAPAAAEGRVLLVGDSVAKKPPSTTAGVSQGTRDALRLTETIVNATNDPGCEAAVVDEYARAACIEHELFLDFEW